MSTKAAPVGGRNFLNIQPQTDSEIHSWQSNKRDGLAFFEMHRALNVECRFHLKGAVSSLQSIVLMIRQRRFHYFMYGTIDNVEYLPGAMLSRHMEHHCNNRNLLVVNRYLSYWY